MIDHVDSSLHALLGDIAGEASVTFEAPTAAWAQARRGPALNLFLYDVQEHLQARAADWDDVRDAAGRVLGRRPPTRRYVLSYLVSAWADSTEDEHRMLGTVLAAVPEREMLPAEALRATLAEADLPVPVRVAVPGAGAGASLWELWSALGHPPRTSLELVVVAPLVPSLDEAVAPPAEQIRLGVARSGGSAAKPGGTPSDARQGPTVTEVPGPATTPPGPAAANGGRPGRRWSGFRITEHTPEDRG